VLRGHDNVRCLFTTPKLLEALAEKISLKKAGITGIFCGGTEMNAQFNRFARQELVPGIEFVPTYGNTLMGLACPKPFDPADDYAITYYPPLPRAIFDLVDPKDTDRQVEYGEVGRVMLTTLTKEFFMPRFLERDEGVRAEPCTSYPWDGVRNLGVFSDLKSSVVVGVY
jgi:phenylacetate-coenzyme A ligase PaaK-like adenylate-forming protein